MEKSKETKEPYKFSRVKVKTIPGLTLNNRDLRERVKNRSIVIDDKGQVYTSDPTLSKAARSSFVENAREYLKDVGQVSELQNKVSEARFKGLLANAKAEGAKSIQKEGSNG